MSQQTSSISKHNQESRFSSSDDSTVNQMSMKFAAVSQNDGNQVNSLSDDPSSKSYSLGNDEEQTRYGDRKHSPDLRKSHGEDSKLFVSPRNPSVAQKYQPMFHKRSSTSKTDDEDDPQSQSNLLAHGSDRDDLVGVNRNDQIKTSDKSDIDHSNHEHSSCQYRPGMAWFDPQWYENDGKDTSESFGDPAIRKPDELENEIDDPPGEIDEKYLNCVQGSLVGMALGDALGAHVEFRPQSYLKDNPVTELKEGGTWGLKKGQFTDDTSMGLCLAISLLARHDFIPYDQLVRYKWWSKHGFMSSTGQCFDIGAATSQSLLEFENRQRKLSVKEKIPMKILDRLSDKTLLNEFDPYCSEEEVAGNGALMRLAPVPLFFFRNKYAAIEFSGRSGQITHGDKKAYDACRFYAALIVAALRGFTKAQILANNFYSEHQHWFGDDPLHEEIVKIAMGSFKKTGGYEDGIRGKGYIVNALEAALWAFWSDGDSFKKGALAAVNLGDDTDTTAAIYGQLAGAYYGYNKLPMEWKQQVYAHKFLKQLAKWIVYEGEQWDRKQRDSTDHE